MPKVRIVTICLPESIDIKQLAATATATLAGSPAAEKAWLVGHFATSVRGWGTRRLVHHWQGTAAGGPVRLLDLEAMRTQARDTFWYRAQIWHQVVAGTTAAKPYWVYRNRHRANPAKYSLAHAKQDYLAQPRLLAMNTYNALPNKLMVLPTSHLEGLQAGPHAYAHLGALSAVPGDAMVTTDGQYLAPASHRLADVLTFLSAAHQHLTGVGSRGHLVALARPK